MLTYSEAIKKIQAKYPDRMPTGNAYQFKNDYYMSGIETIFYESNSKADGIKLNNSHILSLLKKKGYVTAQSANYCFKEFYPLKKKFNILLSISNFQILYQSLRIRRQV